MSAMHSAPSIFRLCPSIMISAFSLGAAEWHAGPSTQGPIRYNRAAIRQDPAILRVSTMYSATIGARRYTFADLKTLMAKATPLRSGDQLAGLAAETGEERVAAQFALADLPLATFLQRAGRALRRPTR